MSKADQIFLANCQEILSRGTWDTHLPVRPRWEDGTPAHTVKCFGLVNRYDLREEFPIQTIRRTYLKSAVDELLWIWQKKSNNVHDLSTGISGTPGRMKRLHRQGLRLSAGGEAPATRRERWTRWTGCCMT